MTNSSITIAYYVIGQQCPSTPFCSSMQAGIFECVYVIQLFYKMNALYNQKKTQKGDW